MDDIEVSESFVQEEEKNEFLDQAFQYENCPHCGRNFFQGKLKYHLKLCKPANPMTKSPLRKTKRGYHSTALQKSDASQYQKAFQQPPSSPDPKYKKCSFCRATFPVSMLERHSIKCNLKPLQLPIPQAQSQEEPDQFYEPLTKIQSKTKIDFTKKQMKEPLSALPRIRNSAKLHNKNVERRFVSQDLKELKKEYTVKIREELSCFKKALEVQQIQCPFCSRRFSKEASLRHIPICEKLKSQEMHQMSLKKHSKSQVYKLNVPVKKSTLLRSKFLTNSIDKIQNPQVKSARVYQSEKTDRQKISNTMFIVKKQAKKQKKQKQKQQQVIELPLPNKLEQNLFQQKQKSMQVQQLNMTFNKDLNSSNNAFQKFDSKIIEGQKLQKVEKQVNQFIQNNEMDIMPVSIQGKDAEVQNEFLQVSMSKKRFFADLDVEKLKNQSKVLETHEKNEQTIDSPAKISINLKDVLGSNIAKQEIQDQEKYNEDFQE